ncbi:nitrogen assimilation transcriptional regulator NAC [Serratia fonticola]|uniref:nitrogen assimilation transcriptional regulator NAC n=1 Tax=Serratia fonticola TaxID=47917 RepID=UPI000E0EB09D|nr:nitrogen assimilation transcriptional regulator NAC [Serratia fonticola]RDL27990.1 LysR family nitrogen assimilation transcriptional regulator [Serratia fonticola]
MNFRRLKYFVKIVDIGSLTQAAEVLHIAQPALSQQVATLEGELKQQLLIRTKRGVMPTEAGNILYAHAQTILQQCEQAQQAVIGSGETLVGQVAVGLVQGSAASQLALPLLQAVRDRHPGILLSLNENIGNALSQQVATQALDMAVMYGQNMPPNLNVTALAKEDLYLVAARSIPHPGNSIDLSAVSRFNLFLPREGDVVRDLVDEALALRQLTPNVIGEIESHSMLCAAIASGMGATILPESIARATIGPAKAWMIRLNAPALSVPLALVVCGQKTLTAVAGAVREILLEITASHHQPTRMLALAL